MNLRALPAALTAAVVLSMCARGGNTSGGPAEKALPDTLRVATLYSPTSYFIYREEFMGYDYSLISRFAADKGLELRVQVAPNMQAMISLLDSGAVDVAAYDIPLTAEYLSTAVPCGPRSESYQVLVQPARKGAELITDETQLVGRDVYVESESKYYHRLVNLNEELGGGVNIHIVDADSLITEDLIEMVSKGEIPLTVVDNNIARLNSTYYPDIDVSLRISFPQRSAWAVTPGHEWLGDSIDAWLEQDEPRAANSMLLKRYFELSKNDRSSILLDLTRGHVSAYDSIFRRYADSIGYDWRLLASQGYVESHFDSTRVSWAGAKGIMQVMPSTARAYGVDPQSLVHPSISIATATRIIDGLDRSMSKYVDDPEERTKFVLGAYNSGIAHVYDAIALAKKYGYDPEKWDGNVAECLLLKSKPEYYNDPVCRFGYFRGRQTVIYVDEVMRFYQQVQKYIPDSTRQSARHSSAI